MAEFYLLHFHGGPNDEQLWPASDFPSREVGDYEFDYFDFSSNVFHYQWTRASGN